MAAIVRPKQVFFGLTAWPEEDLSDHYRDYWTDTVLRQKHVIYWLNFVPTRRPGRPLKRLLDGYNREPETGLFLA